MSGALLAAEVALDFVLLKPLRMIDIIMPDCAVEEHHSDRLMVTRHPVEMGANISDHAFMQPFEVSLRWGWTDAGTGLLGGGPNIVTFAPGRIQQVYEMLQGLMQAREPFDLITGRRAYQNMVLTEMEVTTDQHTANVLLVELRCQEVIIVKTQATQLPGQDARADPGKASITPEDTGQKQLQISLNPPANVAPGASGIGSLSSAFAAPVGL